VDANLNTLGLISQDIPSGYQKGVEDYITEPYTETIGALEGYKILEKYEVIYTEDNTSSIILYLSRFKSPEKCRSAMEAVIETMPPFTELKTENFGDESYIYEVTGVMTLHLIIFIIADVMIHINTVNFTRSSLFEYTHIIEGNINSNVLQSTS
jgi:hypothetical protein